jgi:hypothetical protein
MRDVVEILAEMSARKDADCTAKRPKRQGEPSDFRVFERTLRFAIGMAFGGGGEEN